MRFVVTGRPAHSGANFADGRSAIGELAHKVVALHALTDGVPGITVNVGLIVGGQTVNTVAPSATGEIDLRYTRAPDRAWALERIGAIMDAATVPDTTATWEILGEFLPLEMTAESQRLLDLYVDVSATQGVAIGGEFTGAAPIADAPRPRARRPCVGWVRSAARPIRRTNTWRLRPCWPARRRWPD